MGIFRRKKKEVREELPAAPFYPSWLESTSAPMLLSTVYRCVDLISDSIAVLPLETYRIDAEGFKSPMRDTEIFEILNLEPNEDMTRFVFFKVMAASMLLRGNAYAYIERENNRVQQLIYIPSNHVSIEFLKIDGKKRKRYRVTGFDDYDLSALVDPQDMIHILNFSYDGVIGVSTLTHARQTLGIASNSESHASGFFKSGANMAGVLKFKARLTQEQKDQVYRNWEARTNPVTGKPNGIVILEGDQDYQTISVTPKDSQMLESRQHNVIEICRYFSVSPVKAFDLTKSSYATIEATQLEFLNDTLLPVITRFETEFNRKIFLRAERKHTIAEFNTSVLLRTDKASQASYWNTMFQIGAAKPNEIRREVNLSRVEGGGETFVQVNVQPLKKAAAGNPGSTNITDDGTE